MHPKDKKENVDNQSTETSKSGKTHILLTKATTVFNQVFTNRGMIAGGSVTAALVLTRFIYGISYSFMSLTPAVSLYYGYMGGILTTITVGGCAFIGERAFRVIDPSAAKRAAMVVLNKNDALKRVINEKGKETQDLTAGKVFSYLPTKGGMGLAVNSYLPQWYHPEVQICFTVQGSTGEALVTALYTKKGIYTTSATGDIEYVGVEWISGNNNIGAAPMTVLGDRSKFTAINSFRRHSRVLREV